MTPFERVHSSEGKGVVPVDPESFSSFRPKASEARLRPEEENHRAVYDVFQPGPLYFHAMVNRSLVEGFREAAKSQTGPLWQSLPIQYSVWKFRRMIIGNCGEWNNLLCVMDRQSFTFFKQWLSGVNFVDRGRRLVFMTLYEQAAILDPFLLDGRNHAVPEAITVLCPVSREWHIKPATYQGIDKTAAPARIELEFLKPLPDTLKTLESLADQLSV